MSTVKGPLMKLLLTVAHMTPMKFRVEGLAQDLRFRI